MEPPEDEQFALAYSTAKKFVQRRPLPPTLEFEDIVSECLLGLRKALQNYDAQKYPHVKWSTYAVAVMEGFVMKAYRKELKHHRNRVELDKINTQALAEALGKTEEYNGR